MLVKSLIFSNFVDYDKYNFTLIQDLTNILISLKMLLMIRLQS